MKLYIAKATCSLAAQLVANELGLSPELIHYNVVDRTTSSNESFAEVNPLGYVPVLELDNDQTDRITETIVVASYLADQHPGGWTDPCSWHSGSRQIRPASDLHCDRDRTKATFH
jgi:glutathione S-transferase